MYVDLNNITLALFVYILSMNMAPTKGLSNITDDILKLTDLAYEAIKDARQTYCQNVNLLFTNDCSLFIAAVINATEFQQNLPPKLAINGQQRQDLFLHLLTTIRQYLILIDWEMKHEHKIICRPATTIGVKCFYPDRCNEPNAILFCKLHTVHNFFYNLIIYLILQIPDNKELNPVINEVPNLNAMVPVIFRRWHTMAILENSLAQMEFLKKLITRS